MKKLAIILILAAVSFGQWRTPYVKLRVRGDDALDRPLVNMYIFAEDELGNWDGWVWTDDEGYAAFTKPMYGDITYTVKCVEKNLDFRVENNDDGVAFREHYTVPYPYSLDTTFANGTYNKDYAAYIIYSAAYRYWNVHLMSNEVEDYPEENNVKYKLYDVWSPYNDASYYHAFDQSVRLHWRDVNGVPFPYYLLTYSVFHESTHYLHHQWDAGIRDCQNRVLEALPMMFGDAFFRQEFPTLQSQYAEHQNQYAYPWYRWTPFLIDLADNYNQRDDGYPLYDGFNGEGIFDLYDAAKIYHTYKPRLFVALRDRCYERLQELYSYGKFDEMQLGWAAVYIYNNGF